MEHPILKFGSRYEMMQDVSLGSVGIKKGVIVTLSPLYSKAGVVDSKKVFINGQHVCAKVVMSTFVKWVMSGKVVIV